MTPEDMAALRAAFDPKQVQQIPKGGQQLDYVGHAYVTDRLLSIDPEWSWKPMGTTPEGLPALDQFGNLWIELTICGVTRPGVGDGKSMKECIGDALRNAAMRFGVALDLWIKGDAHFGLAGHDAPDRPQTVTLQGSLREKVLAASVPHFTSKPDFESDFEKVTGAPFADADNGQLSAYLSHLNTKTPAPQGDSPDAPAGPDPTSEAATLEAREAMLSALTADVLTIPDGVARPRAYLLSKQMEASRAGLLDAVTFDGAEEAVPFKTLIERRLVEVGT